MNLTRHRTFQYIGILITLFSIAVGYWYFQVRAGGKLNAPQTGQITSGLVGYWTFDGADTTSSVATDKSTSGNNGTLTNGPARVPGKVGQALSFWPDGVDTQAYINVGDPVSGALDFGSGDFSVGFWMKTSGYVDQSSSVNVPLSKTAVGTGNAAGYYFQYGSSNLLQFVVRNGSTTYALSTLTSIVGGWHYYMGVRSGSTMYLYQDGSLVGSTAVSGSTSNSEFFQIGSYGAGGPYFNVNGSMDEVRVYNRALSTGEIQSLYDLGSSDKINSSISQKQGGGTLSNGLAGYWKFDDGSGSSATDSSTNGTTLTLTNSPSWSTGKIESSLTFFPSGSDTNALASVSDPASGVLDFGSGDFAVSFWAKGRGYTSQGSSGNVLVGKKNVDSGSAAGWYFGINSSSVLQMDVNTSSSDLFIGGSTPVLNDDAWHHIVGLRTGSTVKLYADAILIASGTKSGDVSNTNSFWVGDDGSTLRNFKGEIDEVRTYNRALSEEEISQLYRLTTPTGVDTSLKGYWSFNGSDISGTTAYDRSGAGKNGTLTNGPTVTSGISGQALNFDGTDDYVATVDWDIYSPVLNDISVSVWAKIPTTVTGVGEGACGSTGRFIFGKGTGSNYEFSLEIDNNNLVCFDLWQPGGTAYGIASLSRAMNDGQWHHYTMTIDYGVLLTGYIDGVQVASQNSFTGFMSDGTATFIVGQKGENTNYFSGQIDEPRIHSRVLSASEIKSLYDQGASDKVTSSTSTPQGTGRLDSGLAGYWPLDNGSGTTATDLSSNGNSGTLTNSPTWGTGQVGGAVTFNGSNNYITVPDSTALRPGSNSWSVCTWANPANVNQTSYLVSKSNAGNTMRFTLAICAGDPVCLGGAGKRLVFSMAQELVGPTYRGAYSNADVTTGSWRHFCGVANKDANTVKLYVDGSEVSSNGGSGGSWPSITNTDALTFGSGNAANYYAGSLDETRVYNRALSADEISQLYRLTNPTGTDTSLKGYWSFNGQDVSGTTAYDRSGAGNNGTLTNGPTVTPGKLGQALSFDGTDDYIRTGNTTAFDSLFSSGITICSWVKYTNLLDYNRTVTINDNSNTSYDVWLQSNITTGIIQFGAGGSGRHKTATTSLAAGSWYHVCGETDYTGGGTKIFINGADDGGTVNVTPQYTIDKGSLDIGVLESAGKHYGAGVYDEVRIYNRALSAGEIAALYNSGR